MKKLSLLSMVLLFVGQMLTTVATAEEPVSLRGYNPTVESSEVPNPKKWRNDSAPIPRDYVMQPPLIPHSIERYQINRKFNKCLTCHSWKNYRQAGATKISQTHFEDRDKHVMANVAARRYFCTQCHVSQVDTNPLIENTFKPVEVLQGVH